jgi:protein TonB
MTGSRWSSAICPKSPFIPGAVHWGTGLVVSGAALFVILYTIADKAIPIEVPEEGQVEEIVVSLGAPARRLEPPPPELIPDEPPPEEPPPPPEVKTERAEEAPPPEAPPEPRYFPPVQTTTGPLSSGLGEARERSPPPAPPPPPPPPAVLDRSFIAISTAEYISRVEYPYEALRRRIEGRGAIAVRIDRRGHVLNWRLSQSTGNAVLDREIRNVANKVKQLDPLPASYPNEQVTLIIPFTFMITN